MQCDFQVRYQSSNNMYGAIIPEGIMIIMHEMCARSIPNETGGILVGRYSDDCKWAQISKAFGPPAGSRNGLSTFVRSGNSMINYLNQLWKQNQYYVGEWHYHPNATSTPSYTDLQTIFQLSKNSRLHCPEPLMVIIGGSPSNWSEHVGVYVDGKEYVLNKLL